MDTQKKLTACNPPAKKKKTEETEQRGSPQAVRGHDGWKLTGSMGSSIPGSGRIFNGGISTVESQHVMGKYMG